MANVSVENAASGNAMDSTQQSTGDKISSVTWAVFFIWSGIVLLTNLPWGWFLVGVGIITLTAQLVRWLMDMKIEGFWAACGAILLVGGLWTLLNLPWPLAPILIILLGVALLGKAVGFTR